MKKLRQYFIGRFLESTDDVFEHARAIMLYQFSIMFIFIFIIPFSADIAYGYEKATVLHGIDAFIISCFPFIIRQSRKLDHALNFFFFIALSSSILTVMMVNPERMDALGVAWSILFIVMSALLQRGFARIMYCFFLGWIPIFYIIINIEMKGALTWHWLLQDGAEAPPVFLMFIPIILCIYAIWSHTTTIQEAKDTITLQKFLLEERNKDITDSIHYASRIQQSLLPTEKYIDKHLKRLNKNKKM